MPSQKEAVTKMDEQILLPFEDKNLREPYREYFTTKRKNYLAVVRGLPELWDCFLRLDEIWARDLSNMQTVTEKERPPLIAMFRHSHQQFRIAFELGFSTAITEAWNIMRSSIDTAVVAHKIFREPNLLAVWARRGDGKAEKKAYHQAFEANKATSLFPSQSGLAGLYPFYRDYSEWGTHPGLGAISLHTKVEARATGQAWNHTYLETDGKRTVAFLFRMLEASVLVEGACFSCFQDRLKLDSQLMDMRTKFDKRMKETEWVINNQILTA
jgi:hypothetical protein